MRDGILSFECRDGYCDNPLLMMQLDAHASGHHWLQVPGPSPVPDRILRAISLPTIDHRGPEFGQLGLSVLSGIKGVFRTQQPVIIYCASGTGAWEAALSNTLSPGDRVLMYETGHFATLWSQLAIRLGLSVELLGWQGADPELPGAPSWRRGVHAELIEQRLRRDDAYTIKAVCVVHNETSTGTLSEVAAVRRALDEVRHPALLMVDTISGLACADYRHDDWGVDVTISGSQKGLMMPPGLSFNVLSRRALQAAKSARLPRSYWSWEEMLDANRTGYWPYTPNTNLLYGLSEALEMLRSEGLEKVFARHQRWGACVRAAVQAWGLPIVCAEPERYSPALTGVLTPAEVDADALRRLIYDRFDLSLGTGLGKLKGRSFRIGHLGASNDLTVLATLVACEMGLKEAGVRLKSSGVQIGMHYLAQHPAPEPILKSNTQ
jgi:alanine-glyoxylate transaminase/serine-glyoxylate transaminase/serine-pyruvate transaminase